MSDIALTGQIESILRAHLRHIPEEAPIDLTKDLQELGLDSMSAISVLLDIEKLLGMAFPDEYIDRSTFRSGATLIEVVGRLMED